MVCITHVVINVSGKDGDILLKETHAVSFGPAGLLRVPGRLGLAVHDLTCFSSQEEAVDSSNKGAPFDGMCDLFKQGCGEPVTTTLVTGGFARPESTFAEVWIRAESAQETLFTAQTCVSSPRSGSKGRRHHLSSAVRSRMKDLCNLVCPRNDDGVWLPDKGSMSSSKRPAWCIDHIVHLLREEFDEEELEGVAQKANKYLSRSALSFKRLQILSADDWINVGDEEREKYREALHDFQKGAEAWKSGPYGHYRLNMKMLRQPTDKELANFGLRASHTSSETEPLLR